MNKEVHVVQFHQVQRITGHLEYFIYAASKLYGDAGFIFQQDLTSEQTAKSTNTRLNDYDVTVLNRSVNLN